MANGCTGLASVMALTLLAQIGCSAESASTDGKAGVREAPRPIAADASPIDAGAIAVGDASATPSTPSPLSEAPLARGVSIDEVALYQGTRVLLERGGQPVPAQIRPMPVVAGRDALLRVFVSPAAGPARAVDAEIYVTNAKGQVLSAHKATVALNRRSAEADVGSTFNVMIPGSSIQGDSEFLVRLVEAGAPVIATSTPSPAQYPTAGATARFEAQVAGTMKVVIVPVIYGADGSHRMPDVSPALIDAARKRMLEFYPVPDVDLRVRAPVQWNEPILADGDGWDDVLDAVTELRLTDNAPFDVYYYGAFAPAPTLDTYCPGDCLLGLSNFADREGDAAFRASAGALYPTMDAIDTLPHEIGHAHGRRHAPCGGVTDPDRSYPYAGARTGAWGYSVVTQQLQPPTLYDQMSYCTPAWQSDYTYRALFDRAHALASLDIGPALGGGEAGGNEAGAASGAGEAAARTYRMLRIGAGGEARWAGKPFRTRSPVEGRPQRVSFIGERGEILGEAVARASEYDHLAGGVMIVPYDAPALASSRSHASSGAGSNSHGAPVFKSVRIDLRGEIQPMLAPARAKHSVIDVAIEPALTR
jgi:hypothetical protein